MHHFEYFLVLFMILKVDFQKFRLLMFYFFIGNILNALVYFSNIVLVPRFLQGRIRTDQESNVVFAAFHFLLLSLGF